VDSVFAGFPMQSSTTAFGWTNCDGAISWTCITGRVCRQALESDQTIAVCPLDTFLANLSAQRVNRYDSDLSMERIIHFGSK
jgi:hypothetical protein